MTSQFIGQYVVTDDKGNPKELTEAAAEGIAKVVTEPIQIIPATHKDRYFVKVGGGK